MNPQLRHARRQLLIDRWTEKLERGGYPNPAERARDLLTDMDDLGFRFPEALDDPPPPPSRARAAHVHAVLAEARAEIDRKRQERQATTSGDTPAPGIHQ